MIELLAGPLVGGAVQDKLGSRNWGNLMIALDPAILGNPETILHDVQLMLGRVKGARKAEGVKEIMLPGERGDRLSGNRVPPGIHHCSIQTMSRWLLMRLDTLLKTAPESRLALIAADFACMPSCLTCRSNAWHMCEHSLHQEKCVSDTRVT